MKKKDMFYYLSKPLWRRLLILFVGICFVVYGMFKGYNPEALAEVFLWFIFLIVVDVIYAVIKKVFKLK